MPESTLIVISSPSGGGKDVIIARLMKIFQNSTKLVTTTTREPRSGETPGLSYNFVSKETFEDKMKNNELLEHNKYNGNYYGVDKVVLAETLTKNSFVFTNIDVNGKASLDKNNIKHLAIFLLPESLDVLERRIKARGGVVEEDIKERLKTAKKEIEMSGDYDYKVVNKDGHIEEAVAEIESIIRGVDKKTGI